MDLTPGEDQEQQRRMLRMALEASESRLRRIETRMAVKAGYACPEPDCGLRYRHTHEKGGELVWWPPEGEPWPPRPRGPVPMCSHGEGGREVVMVTDMAAWIDGQAAEVARGLQLPTAPNSDGAPLAADFKTESLDGGE